MQDRGGGRHLDDAIGALDTKGTSHSGRDVLVGRDNRAPRRRQRVFSIDHVSLRPGPERAQHHLWIDPRTCDLDAAVDEIFRRRRTRPRSFYARTPRFAHKVIERPPSAGGKKELKACFELSSEAVDELDRPRIDDIEA